MMLGGKHPVFEEYMAIINAISGGTIGAHPHDRGVACGRVGCQQCYTVPIPSGSFEWDDGDTLP